MKNDLKTVFTTMIDEPTSPTVRTNQMSEKGMSGVKTVSAPEARELRIFGLMRSSDIIKSIRSGVAIEPRPGISGSSSSSDTVPRQ